MTVSSLANPIPSARRIYGWVGFWIILGVMHLCSGIWVDGGKHLPGDLGDGRFNNLVLEHGYQSLIQGNSDWSSPAQFHPAQDTLGWSDTHIGTLPIYLAPRLAGFSTERAMQFWFLLIALLNLVSAYRLFRELGISFIWAAPLSAIAFAGVPWVWVIGTHAQILPVFPGLWTAIFALHFAKTRKPAFLGLVAGAWLGQFAAGPYLAFFVAGVIGTVTAISWILSRFDSNEPQIDPAPLRISPVAWGLTLFGTVLGLVNLWVYSHTLQSGFGRPMQDVVNLTPRWESWFSASPSHRWWPTGWPGGSLDHGEHVMFGGFIPWMLGLGAAGFCWSQRHKSPSARLSVAAAITSLLCVFATVRWAGEFSLWAWLCEHIEPLRGFRAIGRIHIFVHVLLILGFGLWLSLNRLSRAQTAIAAALAALLAVESWSDYQPSYGITEAQDRRETLISAWKQNGDKPVLVFAPGYSNQTDSFIHLDAWAAAMATRRATLNGYSGGAPLHYLQFIWNPERDKAEGLLRHLGVPLDEVSFVERYDEQTARELGFSYQDQRSLIELTSFSIQPNYWELFSPIEEFHISGEVFYQFTPPALIRFDLPDIARVLHFTTGMREGAYTGDNNSDGYDITVTITDAAGDVLFDKNEVFNPRDDPAARGFLDRQLTLPGGKNRQLELRFGPGPSGLSPWDWPLLSRFHFTQ